MISYKIVLLGDPSVGKTSLARRYMGEGFHQNYLATLGAEFLVKRWGEHQLLIWDIGGHRNFMKVFEAYLKGGDGLILVFDVMRLETLEDISRWIDYFITANGTIVPTILVANKIDLRDSKSDSSQDAVIKLQLDILSKHYSVKLRYIETSALTGENIDMAFEKLIKDIDDFNEE